MLSVSLIPKSITISVLNKEEQRKNDAVALTKVERDVLLRVRHPFVVQMAYAFSTQQNLYMVMDFINGGDLYSHMQQQTRFPEAAMRLWAAEISLAVGYLHTVGVVFRDLKPVEHARDRSSREVHVPVPGPIKEQDPASGILREVSCDRG